MDLGQIFTNMTVARFMVSLFSVNKTSSVLDPCFGKGAFIDACVERGFKNITGYELDTKLYSLVSNKYSNFILKHEDFLNAPKSIKYDAIIMNPPYIRHEKIDNLSSLGISKKQIRENPIYNALPSSANMYMYFIIKALHLLKQNGEMIVIFPVSWLNTKSGESFRKLINSLSTIDRQIHVCGRAFETNALVDVVILKVIRGRRKKTATVEFATLNNNEITMTPCKIKKNDKVCLSEPFGIYGTVRRGITTGGNSIFINPNIQNCKNYLVPILSGPKNVKGYGTSGAKLDKLLFIQNEHISSSLSTFLHDWEAEIKRTKKPKTMYEKILSHKKWYKIAPIDSEGILFNYFIREDMKFVRNETNVMARDNFYIIRPHVDVHLFFAMLNSLYTYYQLEYSGKKYGAGLLKIQRYDIENLKFPDVSKFKQADRKELISLAKSMIKTGKSKVQEITKIISPYTSWNYKKIATAYDELKTNRLKGL